MVRFSEGGGERVKVTDRKMCFDFLYNFCLKKMFHSKNNSASFYHKCILVFNKSTCYSCPILMTLEVARQIFEKYPNTKRHENLSSGSRLVPCGRTDMTKLVAFRNSANEPKDDTFTATSYQVCSFVFGATAPPHWVRASSFTRFLDHTQRRTTVGRIPLDE